MTFVFFGTDAFAVKVLSILKDRGLVPALIVTTLDKPIGRKQIITPPPTKVWAMENNVPVIQPANLKTTPAELTTNFDFFLVASYGKIIPQTILDLPKLGIINIHPSLLPKHRGASPLEYTILNGDTETGVTIMQMDAEMDHGPILAMAKLGLDGAETYFDLRDHLATLGAETLANVLPNYLSGKVVPTEQDHNAATYTKLIKKEDGEIDPFGDPITAWQKYRAFIDWPGVYFFQDNKRIIVKKARFESGQFVIERVIPEGKTEQDFRSTL